MARILAQKLGRTSVATPESRRMVVSHIGRAVSEGYSPAVVVSAMARRGSPYASDTLLDLIQAEGEPVDGRDWRQPLEGDLAAKRIRSELALPDHGLVSMVGRAEFIAENYAQACSLADSLGIRPLSRAKAGIRCTFAIPSKRVKSLVRAFYQEFAG